MNMKQPLGLRRDGPPAAAEHYEVRVNMRFKGIKYPVCLVGQHATRWRCPADALMTHKASRQEQPNGLLSAACQQSSSARSHSLSRRHFAHRRGYLMVLLPPLRQGGEGATPQKHLSHAQHQRLGRCSSTLSNRIIVCPSAGPVSSTLESHQGGELWPSDRRL